MAHPEQRIFVENVKTLCPKYFTGTRVLAVGDLFINGGVRDLFDHTCTYVGIDAVNGPGVDWVGLIHEYPSDEPFDVVVSCEVWEHDIHLTQSLTRCFELLNPYGLFVSTHASPKRAEHGTRRTGAIYATPTDPDFYNAGLSVDVYRDLLADRLDPVRIIEGAAGEDVYCYGFKR